MKLRHFDVCSGIGGFALGFRWAALSEPVAFCEIDEYCQKVLAKNFPNIPIHKDLKELVNAISDFENIRSFIEHIQLVMDNELNNKGNSVNILTFHAAKGLEYDNIFLPGWEEEVFPNKRALEERLNDGLDFLNSQVPEINQRRSIINSKLSDFRKKYTFISTGMSSLNAIDTLKDNGMIVKGMISIFTYGFNFAIEKFKSDFFGRVKELIKGRKEIRIVGDLSLIHI